MRRILLGNVSSFLLIAMVSLLATFAVADSARAQTVPEYRLGFRAMAVLIPSVVGTPLENERTDPTTGDSIQRTSTGIFVWRKADNVTAFTNGATTWLIGPAGLQSRPNSIRFDWERANPPAAALQPGRSQAATTDLRFTLSGTIWVGEGSIQNPGATTIDAEVIALGYDADGRPVVDAPSLFQSVPPGTSSPASLRVHAMPGVVRWDVAVVASPVQERETHTIDVGTTRPLRVDAGLAGAVNELRKTEGGLWLLRVSAENGVVIKRGPTPPMVLGTFDPGDGEVVISSRLDSTSAWVRAAVLAHELSHAHNIAAGLHVQTPTQCYREEAQAFRRQAEIWMDLWDNRLPSDMISVYHGEMNDISETVLNDPESFAEQLVNRYRSECGPLAANPSTILGSR